MGTRKAWQSEEGRDAEARDWREVATCGRWMEIETNEQMSTERKKKRMEEETNAIWNS